MKKRGFILSRMTLFFICFCVAFYSHADESMEKRSVKVESKRIICKTPEEAKLLCPEIFRAYRFTHLKNQEKVLLPEYSGKQASNPQSHLLSPRKRIKSPLFHINMFDESPVLGMGLINQEILRISFLLGTDIDIEQATAEELMNSLTELELKPNIGLGFEGYW